MMSLKDLETSCVDLEVLFQQFCGYAKENHENTFNVLGDPPDLWIAHHYLQP
jgi:hypothetical protein